MSEYTVDSADLASVANVIRSKGGTSAQLSFPTEFVSAIQALPTGGESDNPPSPLKVIWGTVTVASENKTLPIPLGNSGITKIIYAQALCADYANWAKYKDYSRVIVRYYANYIKNTLNSGSNSSGITEINANKNLENWNAFSGSISNGFYNMSTSRTDVKAKPDVPFIFIIIGE